MEPPTRNLSQPPAPTPIPAPPSSFKGQCDHQVTHKGRLNEYTQRSGIPFAEYHTVNEGSDHQPKFRSSVSVNGRTYTSPNTYTHRKSAEQHAAKIAMDDLEPKIHDQVDLSELTSLVHKFGMFSKLTLNEYAIKRSIQMPSYNTVKLEGLTPAFRSSLVFNGASYSGDIARNKRAAEQLAARATILSLLDNSESRLIISAIILPKFKLYASSSKVKDTYSTQCNLVPSAVSPPFVAAPEASVGPLLPHHEFNKRKPEEPTYGAIVQLPISFVPAGFEQPIGVSSVSLSPPSKKRRKHKKKKFEKRLNIASQ